MDENWPSNTYDSQSSYAEDSNFDNDLNEAIKLSLQDYRDQGTTLTPTSSSQYLNFNPNGTYFLTNPKSKNENDPFNPSQLMDIVLFFFKNYNNSSTSSVSYRPPLQTVHTPSVSYNRNYKIQDDQISKDYLNNILLTVFGKGSYRAITDHEIIAWCNQGFVNDPHSKLFWGLVQYNNGCCGVLSSIQSFMLRNLIFNYSIYGELSFLLETKPPEEVLFLLNDLFYNYVNLRSPEFPREFLYIVLLIESICTVLYNVTPKSAYHIILYENFRESQDPLQSLLIESQYTFRSFDNINSVANHLVKNFNKLCGPFGVFSLVLSVICTRSLENVLDDMDDPTQPLIASYGHCSQELVNLFLHGRAVSNVFNRDKVIEENGNVSLRLRGIGFQNTLGFLTDLEAVRLYKVGSFYKNPFVPIWVVSSFNHYTVLFGLDGSGCFMTQSDMLEQNLTEAWSEIDSDDNKYIEVKSLGNLLDLLGIKHLHQDALNSIEIVSDLVLWTNFLAWYKLKIAMNNELSTQTLNNLSLFHYNGKENKAPLHKVNISKNPDMVLESLPSSEIDATIVGTVSDADKAIAKVIWTRWPRTSVECHLVQTK